MNKRFIYLIVCCMLGAPVFSQDSSVVKKDTATFTLLSSDTIATRTPAIPDTTGLPKQDSVKNAKDSVAPLTWDRRWFVSPFLKFQVQDFGMMEKNRLNHLSNNEQLSFREKSTISVAASAYKNFSGRIAASFDVGIGYGHVTNEKKLIADTEAKTYNLINAAVYFHLLGPKFRLQPFVTAGINNFINDESYTAAPLGGGFKFTGKKLMANAQALYGYSLTDNLSNTMMYSLGVYFPIRNKKYNAQKKKAEEQQKEKEEDKKNTERNGREGTNITIVNNYYYGNSRDSLSGGNDNGDQQRRKIPNWYEDTASQIHPYDPDEPMSFNKAKRYIVYFNYDEHALTSGAIDGIDQVIRVLRSNKKLRVHLKGHTDLKGSESYNSPLSKKRAQIVFDYMNSRGVASDRMIMSHYGKGKPVVQSDDPNTAWKNRRTEIVIYEEGDE